MKHNRKLNRLKNYNYSFPGGYFVTLCTQNMNNYCGTIRNGKMELNQTGKLIEKYWLEIPKHYDSVELDEFVIMPNHLHGIIMIFEDKSRYAIQNITVGTEQCSVPANSLNRMNYGVLSKIIKSFKNTTTKEIRKLKTTDFRWQRSYYDRIIRSENELNRIREYIYFNPVNFEFRKERNFEKNLF